MGKEAHKCMNHKGHLSVASGAVQCSWNCDSKQITLLLELIYRLYHNCYRVCLLVFCFMIIVV